jgi:hypothetical protein
MGTCSAFEFFFVIPLEPNLSVHIDPMYGSSRLYKGKIKRVSVIGSHDSWFCILNVLKPSSDNSGLNRTIDEKVALLKPFNPNVPRPVR